MTLSHTSTGADDDRSLLVLLPDGVVDRAAADVNVSAGIMWSDMMGRRRGVAMADGINDIMDDW